MEKFVIDTGGRAGGKTKQRTGTEKRGEKGEEEVKAEFGCSAKEIIGKKILPGAGGNNPDGNPLQVPERMEGRAGDIVPDPLLTRIGRLDEGGFGRDGGIPQLVPLSENSFRKIDAGRCGTDG